MKWKVDETGIDIHFIDGCVTKAIGIIDESGAEVCMIDTETQMIDEEWKANARLIAAAPDLLEACKRQLSVGDCLDNYDLMKKAVEKAEGK